MSLSVRVSVLLVLGLLAATTAAHAQAAKTDPAILAAVDAAFAAINAGSVVDAKAAYADPPAAITDDFPPFVWSGKNAVEEYFRDLKDVLGKLKITEWRFQRHQPRYVAATEDHAWLVVPASFPFLMDGKTQSVAGDWIFVLVKQDGKWRVDVSAFGDTHHTLLP
jgi:SnoaL-like domain